VDLTLSEDWTITLADKVSFMLNHKFPKLVNAMYRLDVSEKKFNEALSMKDIKKTAQAIGALIIEREAVRYRNRQNDTSEIENKPGEDETN